MVAYAPVCEALPSTPLLSRQLASPVPLTTPHFSLIRAVSSRFLLRQQPCGERACVQETSRTIKLLDLLTNRYHAGVVVEKGETSVAIELPLSSHVRAGQRVHFIISDHQPLVSRAEMHRAFITQVDRGEGRLHVQLRMGQEVEAG